MSGTALQHSNRIVSSEAEELILVDDNDQPVGQLSKAAAHDGDGQLHRAFSLFLFDEEGRLLIQQRAEHKRLWPGFWSNSCCSHPRVGESLDVATTRRLDDELNISADVEPVYSFCYQARYGDAGSEHELCHVFLGRIKGEVNANDSEISAVRFLSVEEVTAELRDSPDDFTPWFKMEWERLTGEFAARLQAFTS